MAEGNNTDDDYVRVLWKSICEADALPDRMG
jgi:hypothetical protein